MKKRRLYLTVLHSKNENIIEFYLNRNESIQRAKNYIHKKTKHKAGIIEDYEDEKNEVFVNSLEQDLCSYVLKCVTDLEYFNCEKLGI